jgi:hypothetical protein
VKVRAWWNWPGGRTARNCPVWEGLAEASTTQESLGPHPLAWTSSDMHRFLTSKEDADRSPASLRLYAKSVRLLHKLSPALTGGGLPADPWPGRTIRAIANDTRDTSELTTPNIRPGTWSWPRCR